MPQTAPDTRKDLFRSSIQVLVLSVLADGPLHGYAVQKQLKLMTGQTPPIGSLYPLLHKLEAKELIQASKTTHQGRSRKVYTLTNEGQQTLRRAAADWQACIAQLQSIVLPAVRRVAVKS